MQAIIQNSDRLPQGPFADINKTIQVFRTLCSKEPKYQVQMMALGKIVENRDSLYKRDNLLSDEYTTRTVQKLQRISKHFLAASDQKVHLKDTILKFLKILNLHAEKYETFTPPSNSSSCETFLQKPASKEEAQLLAIENIYQQMQKERLR